MIDRPARAIDEALLFYEVRIQRVERALRQLAGASRLGDGVADLADALPEGRSRLADAHAHVHGDRRARLARGARAASRRATAPDGVFEHRPR